jgi:hypothetical protein
VAMTAANSPDPPVGGGWPTGYGTWMCLLRRVINRHLYSSEVQIPEYIHVQEGENIQRTPWRNTIIEKANTYLIPPQTHGGSTTLSLER